jgi:hypothetical protein
LVQADAKKVKAVNRYIFFKCFMMSDFDVKTKA